MASASLTLPHDALLAELTQAGLAGIASYVGVSSWRFLLANTRYRKVQLPTGDMLFREVLTRESERLVNLCSALVQEDRLSRVATLFLPVRSARHLRLMPMLLRNWVLGAHETRSSVTIDRSRTKRMAVKDPVVFHSHVARLVSLVRERVFRGGDKHRLGHGLFFRPVTKSFTRIVPPNPRIGGTR